MVSLRSAIVIILLILAPVHSASAHPIHMSFTEVRSLPGTAVEVTVRVYSNDFSAAAARYTHVRLGADSLIPPGRGFAYLLANFRVLAKDGKPIALIPCGVFRAGDMLRFCFRANFMSPQNSIRLSNSIMTELFHDQVNVVQTLTENRRASRMFVGGDGWKALP